MKIKKIFIKRFLFFTASTLVFLFQNLAFADAPPPPPITVLIQYDGFDVHDEQFLELFILALLPTLIKVLKKYSARLLIKTAKNIKPLPL